MSFYSTFDSYRKAWATAYDVTPPIPLNVDIELASLCNLRCPFCFISDPSFKAIKKKYMPYSLAVKIIDEADQLGVPSLKFNWRGESTIHPLFADVTRYAKEKNSFHELIVNTNGNCHEPAISGLLDCTKIIVSIDSMNPETYKKSRIGGILEAAKNTIHELLAYGHQNVWVRRVLTKFNENENFEEAVKKEWGDNVKLSQHFCFDRNVLEKTELTPDSFKAVSRRYCGYPSQRIIVSSLGHIYPCCVDYYETMPVGMFPEMSLLKAWHSKAMEYLRKDLRNDKYKHPTCKNCTSWSSYDTPQRSYLEK